ncbi:NAD-dependent epimerase/dehydratase family protein [Phycisphaera mikurensis]|uniref:NAD-dependent epimerase/dehydratase family protein n=1 Tax=Phycisphaera mikurensis (strain NBRC 102666 / KCTC 22515 / FYK2301M01) TaxID=1142394 RepID=I0IBC5_PHYMF|nr:NAD-dependent epimerase/dehydratase family protein [Phycisphaera mikurensis]MBB6443057.1 nucleoside-diphosphate-sugar epimerase [Phycisphaera mikurensis]BAM02563.1 NAD-dependent epimerase/dehydratase family protein [Phycisphaera mikurensis NBRC 102666]
MGDPAPIAVTGAAGFLGSAILDAAAEAGVPVRAVLREGSTLPGGGREGVEVIACGLDDPEALRAAFRGCRAVVHAAASMRGDGRDPTATVLDAVRGEDRPLVLISSLSVYGFEALEPGDALTEDRLRFDSAGETGRDAYAALKLGQERHAEALAERHHPVVVLRPGVIVGPGRRWSARLGVAKGPLAVRIGGGAAVPLIDVADCGRAAVRAAVLEPQPGFRAFNLVGDDTPTQRAYLRRIRREAGVKAILPVPAGLIARAGRLLHPLLGRRLPGILRPAAFDARFKPLRYPNDQARAAGLL